MLKFAIRRSLLTSTIIAGFVIAAPAFAQDQGTTEQSSDPTEQDQSAGGAPQAGTDAPAVPVSNVNEGATSDNEEIVVTGTIFRRTNTETPSPVTVLSSESLSRRGITNVADAVRSISADNSGSIPNAFSSGFGAGAAAPALRGLTVNSTLTLVDGLRVVNYPLSDDGQRAFVDLNTMPRVSIERVEVLKDGASSTYGADAIGGVVNVILRKQFNGIDATIEAGTTEHGGGESFRASVLAGWGDYDGRGLNFYVGAEYESNKKIYARDRGFPFDTNDLSSIPGGLNNNADLNNSGVTGLPAIVRPARQVVLGNNLSGTATGTDFILLNPAQCAATGGSGIVRDLGPGNGGVTCEQNLVELYGEIQPKTERFGIVARGGVRLSDSAEAYVMVSWYRNNLVAGAIPQALRSRNPVVTRNFVLPNYICPDATDCENDPLRTLNPYNPYASLNGDPRDNAAQLFYSFESQDTNAIFQHEVLRGATGVTGTFGDAWSYQVDGTASFSRLRLAGEAISLSGFTQAINSGTYNLFNPQQTAQSVLDQVYVPFDYTANAALYMAQGIISRPLMELPGGPLQLGVGAQFRHESLNNPNGNPTGDLIGFNQANATGDRNVSAAFFEISAPVVKQLELQFSGRYDNYSTGFSAFSPKAGFKFTPIPQVAFRGTYSKGFRAPSFAETSGQITGFTGFNHSAFEAVCVEHGGAYNSATARCTGQSPYAAAAGTLGFRSNANPDLDPEKSHSYTLGAVFQPFKQLSLTVDYYNITKKDIIVAGPLSNAAIAAYYAGTPLPAGYGIIQQEPDPLFPNGIRLASIVIGPYTNAASLKTSGLDVSVLFQQRFSPSVRWSSNLEFTDIFKYKYTPCGDSSDPTCDTQEYVGSQGPYILSSGAGTPKWRGNWSNSLDIGRATITATANYVSGYYNTAEDISGAGTRKDCSAAGQLYNDDILCKTKKFIWVDLVGSYKLADWVTGYFNVINLFDKKAPLNPPNYAAVNYNPTYTQVGAVGRLFRIGANFSFRPKPKEVEYVAPPAPPPPPPPAAPATITCADGLVILAGQQCPAPPPPPPPPPAPERGI